jgi:hypothetical protein
MERIRELMSRLVGWPMGVLALAAWFVLLWKMFGDVL